MNLGELLRAVILEFFGILRDLTQQSDPRILLCVPACGLSVVVELILFLAYLKTESKELPIFLLIVGLAPMGLILVVIRRVGQRSFQQELSRKISNLDDPDEHQS